MDSVANNEGSKSFLAKYYKFLCVLYFGCDGDHTLARYADCTGREEVCDISQML